MIQRRFGQYLWRVDTEEKAVYLTFDDGPTPQITDWVLDVLNAYEAKATFFMVGDQVRKHPETAHRVIDEGHTVGNHTRTHLNGKKTPTYQYLRDFAECQQILREYTGHRPKFFRPPYGRITKAQAEPILKRGLEIVMMDIITGDFDASRSEAKVSKVALTYAKPGAIILFHDSEKAWPRLEKALPKVMESLADRGYEFRALGEPVMAGVE
ncbi:MAG: polysaccharide deacetylase family protein [Bacteroidia bacterium]|nr:polysaccharide deacetylase family protein [Bacteroidia bacterium]